MNAADHGYSSKECLPHLQVLPPHECHQQISIWENELEDQHESLGDFEHTAHLHNLPSTILMIMRIIAEQDIMPYLLIELGPLCGGTHLFPTDDAKSLGN